MVAYSFNKRFVDPILSGRKAQTIRANRRRHARTGEELQLYTGMRTRSCRLIGRAKCIAIDVIYLGIVTHSMRWGARVGETIYRSWEPEGKAFAEADGFEDEDAFWAHWAYPYDGIHDLPEPAPPVVRLEGWLIRWTDFAPGPAFDVSGHAQSPA